MRHPYCAGLRLTLAVPVEKLAMEFYGERAMKAMEHIAGNVPSAG